MFCIKCGKNNPGDAAYCQKCGASLADDELTVVAGTPGSDSVDTEDEVFSVGPTLVFVKIGYLVATMAGIIASILVSKIIPDVTLLYSLPVSLLVLLSIPAYKHVRRRLVRYTLTASKVELDQTFITQNARIVPLRSIQDVAVRSSLMQRVFGFGDVVIDNASEEGGKVVLKDIPSPKKYADLLMKELRKLHR